MQVSKRDTDVKNRLLDSVEEGESGMIWENNTETCTLPYVKQMTCASSKEEAGHPQPVLWDNPGDGVRREVGGWFGMGGTCVPWLIRVDVWQKLSQYCKVVILKLKLIN